MTRDGGYATSIVAALAAALSLPLAAALALALTDARAGARAEVQAVIDARLDGAIDLAIAALLAAGPSPSPAASVEASNAQAASILVWITAETDKIDIAAAPESFVRREIERLVPNASEREKAERALAAMRTAKGRIFPHARAVSAPLWSRCFGRIFGAGGRSAAARGAFAELRTDGGSPPILVRGFLPERSIGARVTITAETTLPSGAIAGAERDVIIAASPDAPAWIVDERRFRGEGRGACS